MRHPLRTIAFAVLAMTALSARAQVGIGTTAPAPSAVLDLTSTNQGLLIPRLTQAQRTAISAPAVGLLVYQSDGTQPGFWYFTFPGGWTFLNPTGADNLGSHTATQNVGLNGNWISNDAQSEG